MKIITARKHHAEKLDTALGRLELKYLASHLGGQSKVAELLKVDRSSVSRWLSREPAPSQLVRIGGLSLIFRRLLSVLQPETAMEWLYGINAHLANQKPIDLVREGRLAEVLAAIEQEDTLAYA
jgi:hypothetical protein